MNGKYIGLAADISLKIGAQFRNVKIGMNKAKRTQRLFADALGVPFRALPTSGWSYQRHGKSGYWPLGILDSLGHFNPPIVPYTYASFGYLHSHHCQCGPHIQALLPFMFQPGTPYIERQKPIPLTSHPNMSSQPKAFQPY